MRFEVNHFTQYTYETPVSYLIQLLRLTPRTGEGQQVLDWRIETPTRLHSQIDAFGNLTHLLTLTKPLHHLTLNVRGTVDIDEIHGHRFRPHDHELSPVIFTQPTRLTQTNAALADFASAFRSTSLLWSEKQAIRLMEAIHERIVYVSGSTKVSTTAEQAFAQGQGVCQDQAHVFLACARSLGVAARYVSGYLNTGHQDHLASHAWVDVYTDQHEWLSLDITHHCFTDGRHCRLAVGRDYETAAPVRGTRMGGGVEQLQTYVHVSAQGQSLLIQQ